MPGPERRSFETPSTSTRRLLGSFAGLATCVGITFAFATVTVVLRGGFTELGYLALVATLTGGLALVVLLATGWWPGGCAWALGVWVAIEAGAAVEAAPGVAVGASIALGAAAIASLRFAPGPPLVCGLRVAAALCAGFVIAPQAIDFAASRGASVPGPAWLGPYAGVALGLLLLAAIGRLKRTRIEIATTAAGLLAMLASVAWLARGPDTRAFQHNEFAANESLPNIVVLILDTARADHLSIYGYARETTPHLERFVVEHPRSVVFARAYAPSNWTVPSHLSLFTGLMPTEHQGHCRNGFHRSARRIDLGETLASRLAAAGYRTAGLIANPTLHSVKGAGRGFDLWWKIPRPRELGLVADRIRRHVQPLAHRDQNFLTARSSQVNRAVLGLLDSCTAGGCLVVANYIDLHSPYLPGAPFAGHFGDADPATAPFELSADLSPQSVERAMSAYDEEILELDAQLGRLLEAFDARGLLDSAWLIVTSDHGEAFAEHDSVAHASSLFEEQVRIPLLVHPPRDAFIRRHTEPVGLLDLTATLSALATGTTLGSGRDLRESHLVDTGVQLEFFGCPHAEFDFGAYASAPQRAVVRGDHKLLEIDGRRALYQLRGDPGERSDVAKRWPELAAELIAELPPLEARHDRVHDRRSGVEPDTEAALRELGYLR